MVSPVQSRNLGEFTGEETFFNFNPKSTKNYYKQWTGNVVPTMELTKGKGLFITEAAFTEALEWYQKRKSEPRLCMFTQV